MTRPYRYCAVALLALVVVGATFSANAADAPAAAEKSPAVDSTISVESRGSTDARIKTRLEQLFATLDDLRGVGVEVTGGVVTLSGVVVSSAAHQQALQLARRVENVVEVRDRITESRDLRLRLLQTQERVVTQLLNIVAYLPLLVVAGSIVAFFWWIAGRAAASPRLQRRFVGNPFLRDLARQAIRVVFVGVGLLFALEILDASTVIGSLLGAAGVIGLAVGFALRDTVENYIASLLLSLRQPFDRGDLVVIEGCEGRVLRLNARATILLTLDGNHLRIPNAKVYKAVILNYTRNPKRRFQFDIGVDTEQNLAAAQELAATTIGRMAGVLRDPPPICTVEALGESNVILRVFGWVDQAEAEFAKVRSEAIRLVKGAFDRAGVVMPEPIYNLRIDQRPAMETSPVTAEPTAGRGLPGALRSHGPSRPAGEREPPQAIDISRRDDLERQIAADRSANSEDLLHPAAAKE